MAKCPVVVQQRSHFNTALRLQRNDRFYQSADGSYLVTGLVLAVGGVICFSLRPIFIKLAYAYVVDPVTLIALRMIFAAPFFIGAAFWVRSGAEHRPLAGREFAAVAALGLLSYYGASFLDFLALQYISAGLGRLLLFVYPTIVVMLSALTLGKRVTRRELLALVLTYGGLVLVLAHAVQGEQTQLWLGAALAFASAVCYAVYLVAGSEVVARVGSVDRKSTRLNSSHIQKSRMPSSA